MGEIHLEHTVRSEKLNIRLDLYLKSIGVHLSRSRIIEIIKRGSVTVNGKVEKPSYKVKTGDIINVNYFALTKEDVKPQNIPLNIIYEDDSIIVINKDKNMVVHPAKGNRENTMVNALLFHTNIKGGTKERPGVVHRLDKDTTGVMVFAKTEEAHIKLAREIESRRMKRTYLTIVWGNFLRKQGKIDAPIGRNPLNRKSMAVTPLNSKNAITNFKVLHNFRIASLLKVNLETGRTHQIRVHMTHMGHPVIGDNDYGKNARSAIKKLPVDIKEHFSNIDKLIDRQALHSISLKFKHPDTGNTVEFFAPIPDDFNNVLNYLWKNLMENK